MDYQKHVLLHILKQNCTTSLWHALARIRGTKEKYRELGRSQDKENGENSEKIDKLNKEEKKIEKKNESQSTHSPTQFN